MCVQAEQFRVGMYHRIPLHAAVSTNANFLMCTSGFGGELP